jgi:hypothetical protein
MVDYSVDPASIPALSATTVLSGDFGDGAFRGKDVVIGAATELTMCKKASILTTLN